MSPADSLKQTTRRLEGPILQGEGKFLLPVVIGLVRAVLGSSLGGDYPVDQGACRRAGGYTVLKVLGMPGFLRCPMIVLTVVFDISGIFLGGKLFRYLSKDRQCRQFLAWQESPIGLCRDLTLFYQKMGIFIYFSLVELEAGGT